MYAYKRIHSIYGRIYDLRLYDGCNGMIYLGYSMHVEDVSFGINNDGLLRVENEIVDVIGVDEVY